MLSYMTQNTIEFDSTYRDTVPSQYGDSFYPVLVVKNCTSGAGVTYC